MTGISVTPSPSAPVYVGEVVRATAVGQGGVQPYQFKYIAKDAGPAVRLRDWSTDPSFETMLPVEGTFLYEVWGRSAGATEDRAQVLTSVVVTARPRPVSGPITSISVSTDVASPRPAQQPVRLSVSAQGGTHPIQYKWLANGSVIQDWTTATSSVWTPAAAGTYTIVVWARSANATADVPEASTSLLFTITALTAPQMSGIHTQAFTSGKTPAGTTFSFSWYGEGGTPPYQFRVEYQAGSSSNPWQLLRDWDSATSVQKTVTVAGDHRFRVSGRSAGSASGAVEKSVTIVTYVLEPVFGDPPTSVTLQATRPSPQALGGVIPLTATARGSGNNTQYVYKYQFQLGSGSPLVSSGWSTAGTYDWTPTVAGTYTITVFARQLSAGEDAPEVSTSMTYVITP